MRDQKGQAFAVATVREEDKRLVYIDAEGRELPESQLSDTMNTQRPEQRLLSGVSDDPRLWALRQWAIRAQHEARASEVRGLVGGRISLIPHQLFIAEEVANRAARACSSPTRWVWARRSRPVSSSTGSTSADGPRGC